MSETIIGTIAALVLILVLAGVIAWLLLRKQMKVVANRTEAELEKVVEAAAQAEAKKAEAIAAEIRLKDAKEELGEVEDDINEAEKGLEELRAEVEDACERLLGLRALEVLLDEDNEKVSLTYICELGKYLEMVQKLVTTASTDENAKVWQLVADRLGQRVQGLIERAHSQLLEPESVKELVGAS